MNANLRRIALAAATMAATVAATIPALAADTDDAPVKIRTEGLPSYQRERLEAKAQQGQAALVRYLNRTRMMGDQVRAEDIVVPQPPAAQPRPTDATATPKPSTARETVATK